MEQIFTLGAKFLLVFVGIILLFSVLNAFGCIKKMKKSNETGENKKPTIFGLIISLILITISIFILVAFVYVQSKSQSINFEIMKNTNLPSF